MGVELEDPFQGQSQGTLVEIGFHHYACFTCVFASNFPGGDRPSGGVEFNDCRLWGLFFGECNAELSGFFLRNPSFANWLGPKIGGVEAGPVHTTDVAGGVSHAGGSSDGYSESSSH